MTNIDAVQWWGTWEHTACGASGEDQFTDKDSPHADHVCESEDGGVVWHAEWSCDDCGSCGGVEIFTDGLPASSGHDCDDNPDDEDDDVEGVAA